MDYSEKLSAYLDGELPEEESAEIEERLETDPQLAKELESLISANRDAKQLFDSLLNDPVPFGLVQKVVTSEEKISRPVTQPHSQAWTALAASLVVFALGGAAGYYVNNLSGATATKVASAGWLNQIADYHAIYAKQKRHLVEVPGSEADHIEKWLGKTTNVKFSVPDLADFGLTFEGARLLVVAGKPVAQLMFADTSGTVIALCFKEGSPTQAADGSTEPVFETDKIKGFDFVSWREGVGTYTVVGPDGTSNLKEIAEQAAKRV